MNQIEELRKKLVEVQWVDAKSANNWETVEVMKEIFEQEESTYTVGYVIFEDTNNLGLVQNLHICSDNYCIEKMSEMMVIPKGMVKKIRKVKVA